MVVPDLLTCVKVLVLAVALAGWITVGLAFRFTGYSLKARDTWITMLATALFCGLMGWLS